MKTVILFLLVQLAGADEEISPLAPQEMDGFNGNVQFSFAPPKRPKAREMAGLDALLKTNPNKATSKTAARAQINGARSLQRSKR